LLAAAALILVTAGLSRLLLLGLSSGWFLGTLSTGISLGLGTLMSGLQMGRDRIEQALALGASR